MKLKYHYILYSIALMCCSCGNNHTAETESHVDEKHAEAPIEEKHGEDEIILEPDAADRFGVKCTVVALQPFAGSYRVTGVLTSNPGDDAIISASTSGILTWTADITPGAEIKAGQNVAKIQAKNSTGDDPDRQARAAVSSAKRELDRLRPLLDEGIATNSEYNAALANYEAAVASMSVASSSGSVKSPAGGVITEVMANTGQFVETGTALARITQNKTLVLRADIPESETGLLNNFSDVRIRVTGSDEWLSLSDAGMKRLDSWDMPMKAGYKPAYFSFKNNGRLSSGSNVEVELVNRTRKECIVVPLSAIVEQQGGFYAYVKTGDHSYQKRLVRTGERTGDMVEVISGITTGDNVVTEGAQAVRMAEASGAVPEGHSHNH